MSDEDLEVDDMLITSDTEPGKLEPQCKVQGHVFADHALDHVFGIAVQVENALYWTKRFRNFTKTISVIEENFAKELMKAVEHEMLKVDVKAERDLVDSTWRSYEELQKAVQKHAQVYAKHAHELRKNVAKPTKQFYLNSEALRKKAVAKLEATQKNLSLAREKAKRSGFKLPILSIPSASVRSPSYCDSDVMSISFKGFESPVGSESTRSKLTSLITEKLRARKAQEGKPKVLVRSLSVTRREELTPSSPSVKEYVSSIDNYNAIADKYYLESLPEIHGMFETLERSRIQILQLHYQSFANSFISLAEESTQGMHALNKCLRQWNTEQDLIELSNVM